MAMGFRRGPLWAHSGLCWFDVCGVAARCGRARIRIELNAITMVQWNIPDFNNGLLVHPPHIYAENVG